jgi:hypothetical protein
VRATTLERSANYVRSVLTVTSACSYNEARDVITALFLERDLDFFVHGVRASGLSSYSEAERLNSAETVTLTRAELPSMLKQRVPTSAPELLHNAVEFLTAVSNAIGTGTYAERPILANVARPDDPVLIGQTHRIAAHTITSIDASKRDKRRAQPMAKQVLAVEKYLELHSLNSVTDSRCHYDFQICRNACQLVLGRLCRPSDYAPYHMTFLPCSQRTWRGPPLPFSGYFLRDPRMKDDGHFEEFGDILEDPPTSSYEFSLGLFLIDEVLGKRRHQGRVEYRIRWAPRSGESAADAADRETWQAVADLPSGRQSVCLQKIAAFNAELRGPG